MAISLQYVADANTRQVSAHITYRIEEGVYVDVGSAKGLEKGSRGQLMLDNGQVLVFEAVQVAQSTSLLRLEGPEGIALKVQGMAPVEMVFESSQGEEDPDGESRPTKVPSTTDDVDTFVPLLAPNQKTPAFTKSRNVSHGNIGITHILQTGADNGQDRMATRLSTSGNMDRIFGGGWSFNWSASARYRSGDGYSAHPEYETLQPLVYSAMLQHPLVDEGFVRLGRFVPYELPGVGYLDGVQMEIDTGGHWRYGIMTGFKPGRNNLEVSVEEPTVVGYTTLEAGSRREIYYSGTAGLLASLYQGDANRLSLLFDQRANLGSRFDLFSTAEVDFGIADTTNSQTQLSRFDLTASYQVLQNHTLRAGADHWQRTDTIAERDRLEIVDDELFNDGYWRYWVGAHHRLPLKLSLNEEVAYTISDAADSAVRWRVGLTRNGLFGWSNAHMMATMYNLKYMDTSGLGWLVSAYLPCFSSRISLRPSASMRWLDSPGDGSEFTVSYYALYLDAQLNRSWRMTGGITQNIGDGADATLFDLGIRYSW